MSNPPGGFTRQIKSSKAKPMQDLRVTDREAPRKVVRVFEDSEGGCRGAGMAQW